MAVQPHQVPAYQQAVEQVLASLRTDARRGLTQDDARARLDRHGRNELAADPPVAAWKKFLAQFQDALVILLLVATGISAGLWLYERDSVLPYEAIAICAVVLLNAVIGYVQESRAESAVAALRQMAAAQARVIRDGEQRSVPATEVVPGDIILIEEGDTIPADARVIHSTALQTAEAVLTGESLPVSKETAAMVGELTLGDRRSMVFSGTAATYGRGRAVIVAAVEEGRAIFANIRKFLRYLLSSNIGEVMTMFFGVLLAPVIGLRADGEGVVLPLLATQLLWINLVTDGAPALALGVDPADPGLMDRPPRSKHEGVITRRMWFGIGLVGSVMAAGTLFVLDASMSGGLAAGAGDLRYAQTMAFTTLVLCQLFNVFNARSDDASAFSRLFANAWVWAAVGLSLALQAAVIHAPVLQQAFSTTALSGGDWLRCLLVASSVLWARELVKAVTRARAT